MTITPLIFSLIFSGIGAAFFLFFWMRRWNKNKRLLKDLNTRLLLVRLPISKDASNKEAVAAEINKSAELLGVLAKSKSPAVFEVAVHNAGEAIHFYVAVNKNDVEFAKRQIEALWGGAQVSDAVEDYTIFNSQGDAQIASLSLKQSFILPIRTYIESGIDTFDLILNNFSKINAVGEGLALQIVVRPADIGFSKSINDAINKLKKGGKLSEVSGKDFSEMLAERFKSKSKTDSEDAAKVPAVIDTESIKSLEQKLSKPLYEVNVRLIASSPTPYRTSALLEGVMNSFSQFASPLRNEFKIAKLGSSKKELLRFIFREFDGGESMVLNSDEVVSLFHFPTTSTTAPKLTVVKAKESAPPVNLLNSGALIGESVYRGTVQPIYISDDDRRRHLYLIGQTGTGKSGMLQQMAVADIKSGKGVAIIDPHGDLVEAILSNIPEERYKDVIVFDPGDRAYPLGLNMLEYDPNYPEQKTFIVNEMLNIFDKLYDLKTTGGPMFEQYMRNALLLLMEDAENEPATLMEVPRVFTDAEYRKRKLARITNPIVIDFWEKEATKAGGEAALANITPYVTSKFSNFIANDYMRPIISQVHSAFNFRSCMDEGKILLVNLAKGRIGELNANLLGMIVVGKLLMAAFSRVDVPQEKRPDFYFYIDEFQNFTTDSIATILSEARKYRLNLVIAHQYIAQLKESIRNAVFGNIGSMVVFRVGADDAEFLIKQFEPIFSKSDLINISNRNAYIKLLINGQTSSPFNIKTIDVVSGNARVRDALKDFSRKVYGVSRELIEKETLQRLRE